eukprot:scaffold61693_cov36-Phaeocystis_antarctica.AAC.1
MSCCPGRDRGFQVVGRRRAPPAGPPVDGVLGTVVCPPAPVVCCQRRPEPCRRSHPENVADVAV